MIVCVVSGGLTEFAGQTGVIYLAGQIFYVTMPDRGLPPGDSGTNPDEEPCEEEDEELREEPEELEDPADPGPIDPGDPPAACIAPDVLGTDVEFVDGEDVTTTLFIPGETLSEVQANATQLMFDSGIWEAFQIVGPLECGMRLHSKKDMF